MRNESHGPLNSGPWCTGPAGPRRPEPHFILPFEAARFWGDAGRWAKIPVGPKYPQVVVLVGATGDLSRRKLLPGLLHLSGAGLSLAAGSSASRSMTSTPMDCARSNERRLRMTVVPSTWEAGRQADKIGREAIEEARMVLLPGIQALFGFQLIAVFIERFKELTEDEQLIHFSATVLVTIAIVLIMTPPTIDWRSKRQYPSSSYGSPHG